MQKIRKWFYNHYSAPHHQIIKLTRKWSARNAFYHDKKAEITQLAQKLSGGAPESQAFLGSLQDTTTQLWKRLTIEEQDSYGEIAKDWSDNVPPRGIQARLVVYHYSMYFTDLCVQNGFSRYPWTDSLGLPNCYNLDTFILSFSHLSHYHTRAETLGPILTQTYDSSLTDRSI